MRAEFEPPCNFCARSLANERIEVPRQFHLASLGEAREQKRRNGKPQNAIAQELEALVIPATIFGPRT
jgi:hypothetical protein